jgi:citrate synthase
MTKVNAIIEAMKANPKGVSFTDLCKVCDHYFGKPRLTGSSHRVYKTPWQGDPRINIQNDKGKAKFYQVNQVLMAIKKLKEKENVEK